MPFYDLNKLNKKEEFALRNNLLESKGEALVVTHPFYVSIEEGKSYDRKLSDYYRELKNAIKSSKGPVVLLVESEKSEWVKELFTGFSKKNIIVVHTTEDNPFPEEHFKSASAKERATETKNSRIDSLRFRLRELGVKKTLITGELHDFIRYPMNIRRVPGSKKRGFGCVPGAKEMLGDKKFKGLFSEEVYKSKPFETKIIKKATFPGKVRAKR